MWLIGEKDIKDKKRGLIKVIESWLEYSEGIELF